MIIKAQAEFESAPIGTHPARLYRILDLGTQTVNFEGKINHARKVLLSFELLGDERMGDGRPFTVSRRFTASLSSKSKLREMLEGWRGRAFTPEELNGFDLSKLLGMPCFASIKETERNGQTYTDLASVSALPRSMPAPAGVNEPMLFDLAKPDWSVFEQLSERLQETIAGSPEYQAAVNPAQAPPKPQAAPAAAPRPPAPIQPQPPQQPPSREPGSDDEPFNDDVPF